MPLTGRRFALWGHQPALRIEAFLPEVRAGRHLDRFLKGGILLWHLILGMVLGYVAYRAYRKIRESVSLEKRQRPDSQKIAEPDTLIQDPVCGTFIPRKEALKVTKDGKDYFFCSEGCLKRFRRGSSA